MSKPSQEALETLWRIFDLPADALAHIRLTGSDPAAPSSFAVGTAAQATIAAAALAAAEIWRRRTGQRQQVAVDMTAAVRETFGYFSIDGRVPEVWDKISGLYPCGAATDAPGFVRIHANFARHRDGALKLLGLPTGDATERTAVEAALRRWRAWDFEQAAADAGLVVAAARSFEQWDQHPQGQAVAAQPLIVVEKIGEAPPHPLPTLSPTQRPLAGVRALDLTRILAGPVAGRTLAAYGADVMLVNAPHLPNIEAIIDTSRGKLSAHVDLATADGKATLQKLARDAHIFVQGYRPGAIEALGFGPRELAQLRPGMVAVSLSAYGHLGPWAARRGFDSLVQTATGFNHAEAEAFGSTLPKALPMQMLDYASGFLMAYAAQAALLKQSREGGSWHVRVSLARTGQWLRRLGRVAEGVTAPRPKVDAAVETYESGYGKLIAVPHAANFSVTPAGWTRPSMPPGSSKAEWP
jgi:crotonobetainyl-CoA:carnitine CoA-transferase CaiB-like acyl-CoA transferase